MNEIENFVKSNFPSVWKIIDEEALNVSSIGSAYGQECDENGYPLFAKRLLFRRGKQFVCEGIEIAEDTRKQIEAELSSIAVRWPIEMQLDSIDHAGDLPDWFKTIWDIAPNHYRCVVKNVDGKIIQLVVRKDEGEKKSFPSVVPMQFDGGKIIWVAGQHSSNPLEPLRVCRRPQLVRSRGYDKQDDKQVFTRSPRPRRSNGGGT